MHHFWRVIQLQTFKTDNDVDVTIFEDDIRVLSTVNGAVGTEMDKKILSNIERGENYFTTDANVNGESYFGLNDAPFLAGHSTEICMN